MRSFEEKIASSFFKKAISDLVDLDFLATNMTELGVVVNDKLPPEWRLTETQWINFVYDLAPAYVKTTDEYLECRHLLAMLKIDAKRNLIDTIVKERESFLKQKGAEITYKLRFGSPTADMPPQSLQTDSGITILPTPPPNLPPPPDAQGAVDDADKFFDTNG